MIQFCWRLRHFFLPMAIVMWWWLLYDDDDEVREGGKEGGGLCCCCCCSHTLLLFSFSYFPFRFFHFYYCVMKSRGERDHQRTDVCVFERECVCVSVCRVHFLFAWRVSLLIPASSLCGDGWVFWWKRTEVESHRWQQLMRTETTMYINILFFLPLSPFLFYSFSSRWHFDIT